MKPTPDSKGYFGDFGGKFVPETLMEPLTELERAYKNARRDREFQARFPSIGAGLASSTGAGRYGTPMISCVSET